MTLRQAGGATDGLLLVDKPAGWTSHDVVGRVRRLAGTRKVGHSGTLDPMATGVLLLGLNKGTRFLTHLVGLPKTYTATVRLGEATVTDDAEGDVTASTAADRLGEDAVAAAVAALTGDIEQVPSAVSAIKVDGRRSYARVRGGEEVELAARPVTVRRFDILDRRMTTGTSGVPVLDLDVVVDVSSGTYVRALARDLGAALGVGGHLTALRRTAVGGFDVAACHDLEALSAEHLPEQGERGDITRLPVLGLGDAARAVFPVREVDEAQARTLGYGQPLDSVEPGRSGPVAALAPDGTLVALLDESRARTRSLVVFAPA